MKAYGFQFFVIRSGIGCVFWGRTSFRFSMKGIIRLNTMMIMMISTGRSTEF